MGRGGISRVRGLFGFSSDDYNQESFIHSVGTSKLPGSRMTAPGLGFGIQDLGLMAAV